MTTEDGLIVAPDSLPGFLSYGLAVVVVLLFITLTLGTGVADLIWLQPEPKLKGREARVEKERKGKAKFRDGTLAQLIEHQWRTRSFVRSKIGSLYALQMFRYLGELSGSDVVGRGGWVYQHARVYPYQAADEVVAGIAAARLAAMERRFALYGSRLVPIPIPRKSAVAAAFLPRGVDPRRSLDAALVPECRKRNAECIDLATPFFERDDGDLYYQWDSHWNHEAQRFAAEQVCLQAGILVPAESRPFRLYKNPELSHVGYDLLLANGIDKNLIGKDGLQTLKEQRHYVIGPTGKNNSFWLLDGKKKGLRRVICGTSFTAISSFWQYLSYYGGEQVENASVPGISSDTVLLRFLRERKTKLPEVVFWEIPNHNWTQGRGLTFSEYLEAYRILQPAKPAPLKSATSLNSEDVKPGVIPLRRKWERLGNWRRGAVAHDASGTVLVKLEGKCEKMEVMLRVGRYSLRVENLKLSPNRPAVLPVLSDKPEDRILVYVRGSTHARTDFRFDRLSLCADFDEQAREEAVVGDQGNSEKNGWQQTFSFPAPASSFPASLLIECDDQAPDLNFELRTAEGRTLRRLSRSSGKNQGEMLVDLPYGKAAAAVKLVVSWQGGQGNGIRRVSRSTIVR